jgi:hypothetical protein
MLVLLLATLPVALLLPFFIRSTQAAPATSAVTSLTLINTATGRAIPGFNPLRSGATLDTAQLSATTLSIRANTTPTRVGSVTFALNGQIIKTENSPPYAINGDQRGAYLPWTLPGVGTHTLIVTPYSGAQGSGSAGTPLTVTFIVVSSSGTPTPTTTPSATVAVPTAAATATTTAPTPIAGA